MVGFGITEESLNLCLHISDMVTLAERKCTDQQCQEVKLLMCFHLSHPIELNMFINKSHNILIKYI